MRRAVVLSWLIVYLIVSADCITISHTVGQMRGAHDNITPPRPAQENDQLGNLIKTAVSTLLGHDSLGPNLKHLVATVMHPPGGLDLDLAKEIDASEHITAQVESLYNAVDEDRPGITRVEWVARDLDPKEFDKLDLFHQGIAPEPEFKRFSNSIGKTPTTVSIMEYPYLIQKFCSTPTWVETCVRLGPYTVIQGLGLLFALMLAAFCVRASKLYLLTSPKQDPMGTDDYKAWFSRYKGSEPTNDEVEGLNAAMEWKPKMGISVFVLGYILFEVLNIMNNRKVDTWQIAEDRRAWFNKLRLMKNTGVSLKDSSVGTDFIDEARAQQYAQILKSTGVKTLATSRAEQRDIDSKHVNLQARNKLQSHLSGAILWTFVFMIVFGGGPFRKGLFSGRTWQGTLATWIPVIFFVLLMIAMITCEGLDKHGTCRFITRDAKTSAFGILSLIVTIWPMVRDSTRTLRAIKYDPVNPKSGLGLPERFDFDPRVEDDVNLRSVGLLMTWFLILIVGIVISGVGKSGILSGFVSDGARLFTNTIALIQDIYLFWHDLARYSERRVNDVALFHAELPAMYDQLIVDIVTLVIDVMAIYPIIYDYLTWKNTANTEFLKKFDVLVFVMMIVGVHNRASIVGVTHDDRARGQKYNQGAFAFSCFLVLLEIMVFLVRDGRSMRTSMYALLLFGISVYLYLLVAQNMDDPDRPVVSGHLLSDLYMMKSLTGAFATLQNVVKAAEPRWIYPTGSATGGLLLFNFLKSLFGYGVSQLEGSASRGLAVSQSRVQDPPPLDIDAKSAQDIIHQWRNDVNAPPLEDHEVATHLQHKEARQERMRNARSNPYMIKKEEAHI